MIALTLSQISKLVAGRLTGADPNLLVTGRVEFDSRRVQPGDLFLAIGGEQHDGADFAAQAVAAGAVAVLSTRSSLSAPDGLALPAIAIADPLQAIAALARASASRLGATIIGITGSAGKTSTKDLVAQLLSEHGPTVAPPGSYNNELGHPYTVLLADERTRYLVLENSARGLGHITYLTEIARPVIGAVLNVGSAHLGEFGSVTAIAQAKGELVEALPPAAEGGIAVLNADDPVVLAMASRTRAALLTFGEHRNADMRAEHVQLDDLARPSFDLVIGGESARVSLRLHGEHQVSNALAAAAIASAVSIPLTDVADALSRAEARSRWRMQVTRRADGVTVINDSYNANPESMRAALKALASISRGRRSIAVLGHMAELGPETIVEHDGLGRLIVRLGISKLLAVGEVARPIAHAAALEGSWDNESEWVPDVAAAIARLGELLQPDDVVLVKGSRSAGLESVAAAIETGLAMQ